MTGYYDGFGANAAELDSLILNPLWGFHTICTGISGHSEYLLHTKFLLTALYIFFLERGRMFAAMLFVCEFVFEVLPSY